jgi:hypothetical protein
MPALDATATLTTAADMHVEPAHVRLHDRQIFLQLRRHARFGDATAAVRTRGRQRNVNDLVDGRGRPTMAMATVAPTGSSSGWPRMWLRGPLRERRRLPPACAPRGGELSLQSLVFTLQSFASLLRFLELPPQTIEFSIEIRERWWVWLGTLTVVGHALVMPESPLQYKRDPLTNYV